MITLELTVGQAIEVFTMLQRAVGGSLALRDVWPDMDAARPELQQALDKLDRQILRTLKADPVAIGEARAHLAAREGRAACAS